jgi:phosphomannomutase
MKTSIRALMTETGVKFGTSGARGLVTEMTDRVCHAYTKGFLQYLAQIGQVRAPGHAVAVGGDLRPSTSRIMEAVFRAIEDFGCLPINCGRIPSPALALYGLEKKVPAIMVTGSHIPADRNGIKFNRCDGEILKADESGIAGQEVDVIPDLFDASGAFARPAASVPQVDPEARALYARRYLECFAPDALRGLRLGVYQHSAVGRELLIEILERLGAECTSLGFSDSFVPVDTEAIRPEDERLAAGWAAEHRFDAVVSTDGDSDRPLISDEQGRWLRGDIAGILCAKFLGADSVSTPVSSNSAVERCGWFRDIRRTRIGSPYVVASMLQASASGFASVVGYEANGGFLLGTDIRVGGRLLRALPTRDALILLLGVLLLARKEGRSISGLASTLPPRFTASGLLQPCPPEKSQAIMERFTTGSGATDRQAVERVFGSQFGRVAGIDRTDGIRISFESGEILHLRPSGNAPEFRCYTEASSPDRARRANAACVDVLGQLAES